MFDTSVTLTFTQIGKLQFLYIRLFAAKQTDGFEIFLLCSLWTVFFFPNVQTSFWRSDWSDDVAVKYGPIGNRFVKVLEGKKKHPRRRQLSAQTKMRTLAHLDQYLDIVTLKCTELILTLI